MLAVDDEPVARQQLAFQIAALGYEVSAACTAIEAQEILAREGSAAFDCLITDCWMPGLSGLDLLLWLKSHDNTLASIVISKAADENVITRTLRGGASDFLRKPIFSDDLIAGLQRAVDSTRRRRQEAAARSALREAGAVQRRMNSLGMTEHLAAQTTVCYHPCHDSGGDSVAFFALDSSRMLIVVADVSGHDLKSAFVSAYFQGSLRAMVEEGVPIEAILPRFNRFLIHEWNVPVDGDGSILPEITSFAVCAVCLDLYEGYARLFNCGFPLGARIDQDGEPWLCGETGGNPLGWFEPNLSTEVSIVLGRSDRLVVWTDGLEDLASELQVSEWSLAFGILLARERKICPPWLKGAPDDVLLVAIGLEKRNRETYRFPLLAESCGKAQTGEIDQMQAYWKRSLTFALPELSQQSMSEILLCTREAVLNGLQHGCSESSDRCRLTMVFDGCARLLQVNVQDTGPGFDFDLQTLASEDPLRRRRGLALIHGLAHGVEHHPGEAAIRMFFKLPGDEERRLTL
ncbi:MAG TPA: fused response regulator/phosphatase [Bryobacteraceae bacterium]|nr:fused response regulator/phosphatase [Bryobacteraceae bacterium]